MDDPFDKMLERAKRMEADPPRSKLDDYAEVIWELRRKRKRVRTIAAFLNEHGVRIHRATVARWLKTHPVPRAIAQAPLTNRSVVSGERPSAKLWPVEDHDTGKAGFFDSPIQ
jgi:hypothetical protein